MYNQEIKKLMLIFHTAITSTQYNESVIDHVLTILCFIVKMGSDAAEQCLYKLLTTEYYEHAVAFLMRLIAEPDLVNVTAIAVSQKKRQVNFEYSYKLVADSISTSSKELLEGVWNNEDSEISEDILKNAKNKTYNRILSGAIYLLYVFPSS